MRKAEAGSAERLRVTVSPWAALMMGWIVYCTDGKTPLLLFLPVAAHELGHWFCLRITGCRIRALRMELSGLSIRYTGDPGPWGQAVCAMAGPLAGLLYAWSAARFGSSGELSAGVSVLLSLFNLIPALPLDGGHIALALLGRKSARRLSLISTILTTCLGLLLFVRGRGASLALAGLCLLAAQDYRGRSSAISPE